jgi:hypothetical protein
MFMAQMIGWMFPKNTLRHHEANVKTELKSVLKRANRGTNNGAEKIKAEQQHTQEERTDSNRQEADQHPPKRK